MKLGLLTAALPGMTLQEVAQWAADSGYQMLEIACWPASTGKARRYAGVTHIDVESLDAAKAKEIRSMLDGLGLGISALAYYPNPLHPDLAHRETVVNHLKRVIDAAQLLEVPIVGSFVGADQTKSAHENMEEFPMVWAPIVRYAAERGIKIAIENCPMLWHDTWPGGQNVAYSPTIWRQMFEAIPDDNFGLNLDPSHLIWQFIDEVRVVKDFAGRIFHVHAKDMEIDRELLYQGGVLTAGVGWAIPRLPGLGEVRWSPFIAALYAAGYDDVISVEHEDRAFEATEELVKRGFYLTRDVLRPLIA